MGGWTILAVVLISACRAAGPPSPPPRQEQEKGGPAGAVKAPTPAPPVLNGFSLAYQLGVPVPAHCEAQEGQLLAIYAKASQCHDDADCVAFGSCDGLNRDAKASELLDLQDKIVRQGCKVSWGSCVPAPTVCARGRCVRKTTN
jgi:hypothetical protein